MFVTYTLYSPAFDKIYIGYTSDLIDRYYSQNFLFTKGFTKNFRPWIVVYVESETQFKSQHFCSFIHSTITV